LIIITLVGIELHGRNKCLVNQRKEWNTKNYIIDVFATFLLPSCSKVLHQSVSLIQCSSVLKANSKSADVFIAYVGGNDLTSSRGGSGHLSFAIPAGFMACVVVILVLLLILYPFKWFRGMCFFLNVDF
jgi:hypothetical protein